MSVRVHFELDVDLGERIADMLREALAKLGIHAKQPRWGVFRYANEREVHIVPLADEIEHEMPGGACICFPDGEFQTCSEHGDSYMYTHHSLDGREAAEAESVSP